MTSQEGREAGSGGASSGGAEGVSYIVNAWGKAHCLPAVLARLAAQDWAGPKELIVLDGGSADGAGAVARRLLDDWPVGRDGWAAPRLIHHPDSGPADAFNRGAAAARFAWLKPMDGDDRLAPWATGYLLDVAAEHGADFVVAQGRLVPDPDERELDAAEARAVAAMAPPDPLRVMIRHAPSNMSGSLMRERLWRSVGGCDTRIFIHDYSLALRAAHRGRVAFTEARIWQGPLEDPGRIMNAAKRQLLHDFSAALAAFAADHPDLPHPLQRLALKRALGRAAKWARREEGQSLFSRYVRLGWAAHLPWLPAQPHRLLAASLGAFRLSGRVRTPLPPPGG